METPCPAVRASEEEKSSDSLKTEPSNDSLKDLVESLSLLTKSLDIQNSLLMEVIDQNSQLISMLAEQDEEHKPATDLAGRPLK